MQALFSDASKILKNEELVRSVLDLDVKRDSKMHDKVKRIK